MLTARSEESSEATLRKVHPLVPFDTWSRATNPSATNQIKAIVRTAAARTATAAPRGTDARTFSFVPRSSPAHGKVSPA